jgi:hypothetical protein
VADFAENDATITLLRPDEISGEHSARKAAAIYAEGEVYANPRAQAHEVWETNWTDLPEEEQPRFFDRPEFKPCRVAELHHNLRGRAHRPAPEADTPSAGRRVDETPVGVARDGVKHDSPGRSPGRPLIRRADLQPENHLMSESARQEWPMISVARDDDGAMEVTVAEDRAFMESNGYEVEDYVPLSQLPDLLTSDEMTEVAVGVIGQHEGDIDREVRDGLRAAATTLQRLGSLSEPESPDDNSPITPQTEGRLEGVDDGSALSKALAALDEIAARPTVELNPDGKDQAAEAMALLAREYAQRIREQRLDLSKDKQLHRELLKEWER